MHSILKAFTQLWLMEMVSACRRGVGWQSLQYTTSPAHSPGYGLDGTTHCMCVVFRSVVYGALSEHTLFHKPWHKDDLSCFLYYSNGSSTVGSFSEVKG